MKASKIVEAQIELDRYQNLLGNLTQYSKYAHYTNSSNSNGWVTRRSILQSMIRDINILDLEDEILALYQEKLDASKKIVLNFGIDLEEEKVDSDCGV